MTELNTGQKHLVAEIDKYRNLLRDVARDIEDCKYNRKITHSFDFWPEPISEENWKWIAYQFVSTLLFNNVPNKLIAAVKAANRILVKLTEPDGFDQFLEDETFCKEKIASLFETNYLLDEFLHNKILKDVPSNKAKNKTDSGELTGERKKEGVNTGDKSIVKIKPKVFTFTEAQAFYKGKDLNLPSSKPVKILELLANSIGQAVRHSVLDTESNTSNASDSLRENITTIRDILKHRHIPFRIMTKRGFGYVLTKSR